MESDMIFLLGAKQAQHKAASHRDRRSASMPQTYASMLASSTPFLSPPRRSSFFASYVVERSGTTRLHDDDSAFPSPTFV
jgi:hypothetical protein